MHMNPSSMDADGVLNGRRVAEGEKIGVVSNYLDYPNGTSPHLHFDVQVFTRDGWLWVNPYTTLISAYERLIRGRGRELGTDPVAPAAVAHALPRGRASVPTAGRRRATDDAQVAHDAAAHRPRFCRAGGVQRKAAPNRFQTLIEAIAEVR